MTRVCVHVRSLPKAGPWMQTPPRLLGICLISAQRQAIRRVVRQCRGDALHLAWKDVP